MSYVLAIDQGTTSTRALLFDAQLDARRRGAAGVPPDLSRTRLGRARSRGHLVERAGDLPRGAGARPALRPAIWPAIGITNQRETTVLWDRADGQADPQRHRLAGPPHRANMRAPARGRARGDWSPRETGLLLDPYFSATKIRLAARPRRRRARAARARRARLRHGRLLPALAADRRRGPRHRRHQRLAHAAVRHPPDAGTRSCSTCSACRRRCCPRSALRRPISASTEAAFGARSPIRGIAGDQQAALFGQACFEPGMAKSTYGTGCFMLLNTGDEAGRSRTSAATTIAYQLDGRAHLRARRLDLRRRRRGAMAARRARPLRAMPPSRRARGRRRSGPARSSGAGLRRARRAHWDATARGAIFGLTRGTSRAKSPARRSKACAIQTRDLLAAMQATVSARCPDALRVDGGMVASDWTMQRLADIVGAGRAPADPGDDGARRRLSRRARHRPRPSPAEFAARWKLERAFRPPSPPSRARR